jgi:hypothetical protein
MLAQDAIGERTMLQKICTKIPTYIQKTGIVPATGVGMRVRKTASSKTWRLQFDWEVDAAGYVLEEFEPVDSKIIAMQRSGGWRLVRRGGVLEKYRLSDLESRERGKPAFTEFANIGQVAGGLDRERLIAFANSYGMPSYDVSSALDLEEVADSVHGMRRILGAIISGKATDWRLGRVAGSPEYYIDSEGHFGVQPRSLPAFMWLQLMLARQQGIEIKRCVACGNFMAPKSEKRDTCSDACRQKIYRRRDENQATHGPHGDHAHDE